MLPLIVWAMGIARGSDVVLEAMETEMQRTMEAWDGEEGAPYFMSYRVRDRTQDTITARYGAVFKQQSRHHKHDEPQRRIPQHEWQGQLDSAPAACFGSLSHRINYFARCR